MSDIQFDEPGLDYVRKYAHQKPAYSGITNIFIKAGFAKNESQAAIVMIVVAIVAAGMAYMFWPSGVPVDNSNPQPLQSDF